MIKYNYMFFTNPYKFFLSLNSKTSQQVTIKNSTCGMFDANNIYARSYVPCMALMPIGCLKSCFNTIQTLNTFENEQVIRYNEYKNIHNGIFTLQSAEKGYSASARKTIFLLKKSV